VAHPDIAMDDRGQSREQLLAELDVFRRRIAELEAMAVEHRRTAQRMAKDAQAADAALRQSEATEHALVESASEGIVLIDGTGRIILVNAAAERMFGYGRQELLAQPLEILLPERVRAGHIAHRTGYFTEPRVRPMGIGLDLSGRRKDGSEFPVEISLSYVQSADGMVAMAFVTDITERKRVEAELRQQREALYQTEKLAALGTLAAGIAHEMNNPLGIITSRIEIMLMEAQDQSLPASVLEDLGVLHRASQRVARIASSLRSFARQSPEEHAPIDVNVVVEETLLLMQKPLTAENIRITTRLERTLPPILGDTSALQQVMINLLTNAREAMTAGGEIRIETGPVAGRPGWLKLVVMDTGPGIPSDVLPKIFDPFYTTKRAGTGLGLSVSYAIVQGHQGVVDVQSRPGEGTTFTLSFPHSAGSSGGPSSGE
jgi:PAS domain S-box-containing protein